MGYEIRDDEDGDVEIYFKSKTLVGLHEEIDRYVKEKDPARLIGFKRDLVPEYHRGAWILRMWIPKRYKGE